MITAVLETADGRALMLKLLLSCKLEYGTGLPCDSFSVTAAYDAGMAEILPQLCRFRAEMDGETVFTGVVDEYTVTADEDGAVLAVSGRSLAALLLDGQVRAADWGVATLRDILDTYVVPAGVGRVDCDDIAPIGGYSIASGASRWQAVADFAGYSAGITPRFLRDGTLCLKAGGHGRAVTIDDASGVVGLRLCRRRYGVISSVTVINRVAGTEQTVTNGAFVARGGRAERVVNVTSATPYKAMRYTGEYRIAQSERGANTIRLTLTGWVNAQPTDKAKVELKALGLSGSYEITNVEYTLGGDGDVTRLTLAI